MATESVPAEESFPEDDSKIITVLKILPSQM
jgi:hypothetical protein